MFLEQNKSETIHQLSKDAGINPEVQVKIERKKPTTSATMPSSPKIEQQKQKMYVDLSSIEKPINKNLSQPYRPPSDLEKPNSEQRKSDLKDYENYLKVFYRRRYIKKNVITKYAFATRVGYIPSNAGKVNQDSYILVPGIQGPEVGYKHFFGVCDGHGSNGHHASAQIKEQLPEIFKKAL